MGRRLYRGKWLEQVWPNRRDQDDEEFVMKTIYANHSYQKDCFLERGGGVIDPEENQLSPLDGAKWRLPP